ncbi:PEP-utilizing enzyme [uncultured Castellaniella sp.]|uniref:PEP-utilizing enzyme n=1 Tax=uncultured Castellaniella sp. TaxID=647907 RepID=UPI00261715AF|nr:PEP-utilizing enzyme [uncultured Castellaniella sp.]
MDPTFAFGTKAETLNNLTGRIQSGAIGESMHFSCEQWQADPERILTAVQAKFGAQALVVRSSALSEDAATSSMAGAFLSILDVAASNRDALDAAIRQVAQSMTGNPKDQVLIQAMARDIVVSGVVMTYDMVHGAPYFCIDYDDETGRTDAVTSGNGVHKSLYVHRECPERLIRSDRIAAILKLARELEQVCHCAALDIEFGLDSQGGTHLFQVRRIALARNWHPVTERRVHRQLAQAERFIEQASRPRPGILGARTILAVMPDWNPAEIIGTTPRPLAASLYRHLITERIWSQARARMGYRDTGSAELMLTINHHPYIDVRNSFNSFLPAALPDGIGNRLVDAWLQRLEDHPEFHDKVEFEIVPTCLDFCFDATFTDRYPTLLSPGELDRYRASLLELTLDSLRPGPGNTLDQALEDAGRLDEELSRQRPAGPDLDWAAHLLDRCKESGTLPFSMAARHAFIAETLLRSAVRRKALTQDRLAQFKRGINTVTRDLLTAYQAAGAGSLSTEAFFNRYGHLRPGTYEITSLRYDERDDLFTDMAPGAPAPAADAFAPTDQETQAIDALLSDSGFVGIDTRTLLEHAAKAIAAREQIKFIFTRCLSDALSAIIRWGASHGLSRDDLSFLDWDSIRASRHSAIMDDMDRHYLDLADHARRSMDAAHALRLSHILFGGCDIHVATLNRSVPNFIGLGQATGAVVRLGANTPSTIQIQGRIICIENADPGFDWIFTKSPGALITQYGGANSHMAVRCAELGLPAAIGVGEQIYRRISNALHVELNCVEKILRPVEAA